MEKSTYSLIVKKKPKQIAQKKEQISVAVEIGIEWVWACEWNEKKKYSLKNNI